MIIRNPEIVNYADIGGYPDSDPIQYWRSTIRANNSTWNYSLIAQGNTLILYEGISGRTVWRINPDFVSSN